MSPADVNVATDAVPRRGRRPQTPEQTEAARGAIVEATRTVFAAHGWHGMSVALIIEAAGIARPTFYRYFANAEEPLQAILDASDLALADGLKAALDTADDEIAMVVAGIGAYLDWARDHGPVLRPLFAELHDPTSPVSPHRERTHGLLRDRLVDRFVTLGRAAPPAADIDVMLNTFEYVGYRVSTGDGSPAELAWAAQTMARVAAVLLGSQSDLERALAVPGLLWPAQP